MSDNVDVTDANPNLPDYFRSSTDRETDKKESWVSTQGINNTFSDVFSSTGYFEGMFRLQVKEGS